MRKLEGILESTLLAEGSEPVLVVEIDWTDTTTLIYSDKDLTGAVRPIETAGLIDVVSQLSFDADFRGITESSQITLALFDTDNALHDIMHSTDIHKRPVRVYMHEPTIAADYRDSLLFLGQINSPITWDEGTRRMQFTVLSELESAEVGFSIEEGQFAGPPEDLIGKPWPLCFGTVKDVPALHTHSTLAGRLGGGTGIIDGTLLKRLQLAISLICPKRQRSFVLGIGGSDPVAAANARAAENNRQVEAEVECARRRCEIIENLRLAFVEQIQYEEQQIKIYGGKLFPQGTEITLDIGGSYFTGSFTGTDTEPTDFFDVTDRVHKELIPYLDEPDPLQAYCDAKVEEKEAKISACGHITVNPNDLTPQVEGAVRSYYGAGVSTNGLTIEFYLRPTERFVVGDEAGNPLGISQGGNLVKRQYDRTVEASKKSFQDLADTPSTGFFWARAGTQVLLVNASESVHIANLIVSEVHYVKAFRETSEGEEFVEIPEEFYTVRLSNFASYTVTEIVFDPPLSQRGQGWKDQIYVTMTSVIGPNPVDIMTYLIDRYTSHSMNSLANDIRHKLAPFPMHFCVDGRPDVNELLTTIAFHARCAITFRRGSYSLFFLAEVPTVAYAGGLSYAIRTIGYGDIDHQTLVLDYTPTEDVVTKMNITWRDSYNGVEHKLILRHNIAKYGVQEEEFDWSSYTIRETVKHTATFWLIRLAKVYRIIRFSTPPHLIALEPLDPVYLEIPDLGTTETITGVILSSTYDSSAQKIDWVVWTPILAGTTVPYRFAWPADLGVEDYWPTFDERAAGFAGGGFTPGFNVIPPSGHPLSLVKSVSTGPGGGITSGGGNCARGPGLEGFHIPHLNAAGEDQCDDDQGDEQPSDTGASAPEVELEEGDGGGIDIPEVPMPTETGATAVEEGARLGGIESIAIKAQEDANRARGVAEEAMAAANGGGSGEGGSAQDPLDEPDDPIEELPEETDLDCSYQGYFFSGVVTVTSGGSEPGDSGQVEAFVTTTQTLRSYGSLEALNNATIEANIPFSERGPSEVGETVETNASRLDVSEKDECEGNPPGLLASEDEPYPPPIDA